MLSQTCILLATMALLLFPGPPAAAQGTTPVPITFGTQDDIHPSTINSDGSAYDNIEWLAFVRMSGSGSRICLKKSNAGASSWE